MKTPQRGNAKPSTPAGFAASNWLFALAATVVWSVHPLRAGDVAAEPQCVILAAEGKVEVALRGKSDWAAATTNQVLHTGDRVRTGLRSRATLRWSDLSVVRVDQLTSLELAAPEQAGGKSQLDLKSGAAYLFSREKPMDIQFRTPVASGAIRGTEFNLAVAEDGRTELTLLDGEVDLKNPQGAVTLASGERGTVESGKAPTKTAVLDPVGVIQWALYYPAVADPDEIGLNAAEQQVLAGSLTAYRAGDLVGALHAWPQGRTAGSEAEHVFHAALSLAAGRVDEAEAHLAGAKSTAGPAHALRELIGVVKGQASSEAGAPATTSEKLARSYSLQSRSQLGEALALARDAAANAPTFGAAWIRAAELEFSFGHADAAMAAVEKGLQHSPRSAQGLALRGFLASANGKQVEAMTWFDQAIAADGALGNAWLGRGLLKIRQGDDAEGRADLQVAAALEPQRAILRSYLGKAFSRTRDQERAEKELALAQKLDPNDPTAWLYSALQHQQENRINDAARDLEKSKELNDNRSLFRSRLLLDQDQAVRSANLASIYRDAGMFDVSVQEASQAVSHDYANASAHLFLASSYDYLSDPRLINLRYETPAFSEYLVANLLSPAGGGALAQTISQQEYSRFFAADHFGASTESQYFSSGDWQVALAQYGVFGGTSYSLDGFYREDSGQRPNNDFEQWSFAGRLKQQLTPKDNVYVEVSTLDLRTGDVAQYYRQSDASQTLRVTERQTPNVLFGYHHEWSPGNHTLLFAGRFDDTLTLEDSAPKLLFLRTFENIFSPGMPTVTLINPPFFSLDYERELTAYSAEVQQIWQTARNTLVVGARYQTLAADIETELLRHFSLGGTAQRVPVPDIDADLNRLSFYAYDYFRVCDQFQLTAGLSYDRLHYPRNIDTSPISNDETPTDQVSPKAGIVWSPCKDTQFRGIYTRSLGGTFFDTSVRLEPTQIAGFNQAFRSIAPESVVGLVPATRFETFGLGWNQKFKTGTYLLVDAQFLASDAARTVGLLTNSNVYAPVADSPSGTRQSLDYEEQSLSITLNQLIGPEVALGARYRLTYAELDSRFTQIAASVAGDLNQDVDATLHQIWLYAIYNVRCGFFAQADAVWSSQSNDGYSGTRPGDEFWQFNLHAGYRFWNRRAEARVGLLNLSDQDYRLNPLTLYNELPRERTFTASLKLYF